MENIGLKYEISVVVSDFWINSQGELVVKITMQDNKCTDSWTVNLVTRGVEKVEETIEQPLVTPNPPPEPIPPIKPTNFSTEQ